MKNRMQFQEKQDPLMGAGFIALILCLAFRIPLMRAIGAEGLAYFAPANEVFLLCIAFCNHGFSEALSNMMRYRIKREQYRNANRIFRAAYAITITFGLFVVAFVLIFNSFISNVVFLQHFSQMALYMIAPAIALMAFTCLLRGYFQGMGSPYPSAHSMIVEQVFTIIFGLVFALYFVSYGEKVAGILRNEHFSMSYGAMGAAIGIAASSVISFLHLFVIYIMYRGTTKRQIYRDNTRQIETSSFIYQSLLLSAIPIGAFAVLFQLNHLIDQRMFYYYFNKLNENGEVILNKAFVWGNYYGIYLVIVGILTAMICMIFMKNSRAISAAWFREEYRVSREKLMQSLTAAIIIAIPVAVLTAVLAEPIASLLDVEAVDTATKLLQNGSILIVFYTFSYFWFDLLKQFKKTAQVLMLAGGGLAIHIFALLIIMPLIKHAEQLIIGIIVTNIIGVGFSFMLGFFLVKRMLNYQGEWMNRSARTLMITMLCSAIIGLMVLALSKGILNLVGPAVTILICLLISLVAYLILMILLRGLTISELDHLPGGQFMIRLGRLIRFF